MLEEEEEDCFVVMCCLSVGVGFTKWWFYVLLWKPMATLCTIIIVLENDV
jgi:hypothetical protein